MGEMGLLRIDSHKLDIVKEKFLDTNCFTMNYRTCFDNSLRFTGTLLRYNKGIVPIMLTSIRSHSHLSSHVIIWIFPLCKGRTN